MDPPPIISTIEPRMVIIFWAYNPISFKNMSFWYKHLSWSHTWQHIKYRRLIKINNQIKHIYLTKTLNSKVTHTHTTSHRRTSPSKWQPTRNKCFMSSCFGPSEWVNLGVTNLRWSPFAKNKKRQTLITCRSIFRVGQPSCVRDGDIQYVLKILSSGVNYYIQGMGVGGMMCTKMSVPPYVCWSQWANLVAESSLQTSRGWKAMRFDPTSCFNDSTALFPRVSSRAVMMVVKPLCASWRAISYPIPLLAPVTTATVSLDHHLKIHEYNRINPIPICNIKYHLHPL